MDEAARSKELSLQRDALEFAGEFVRRMRAYPDLPLASDPSTRQAIAIPAILTSRWMRHGSLTSDDFITAAVATSHIDNQEIARKIAIEILTKRTITKRKGDAFHGGAGQVDTPGRKARPGDRKVGKEAPVSMGEEDTAGAGSGEETFAEWLRAFRGRRDFRERVYEQARRIRIASDSSCEHTSLAIEDSGILDGEKLRPFDDSTDPDLVDFEESIESIFGQGKRLLEITREDLMVRERRGQRKAVVLLEDISGSMGAALKHSVICIVTLLYAFRRHEVALAFFEGNPYVLREFFSGEPVEKTIERVLSASTMYGTMGGKVLEWAHRHLEQIDARYYDKLCIICSDMGFFDIEKVVREIKTMKKEGIEVIIILPPGFVYRSAVDAVRKAGPLIIELDREKMARLPEVVSDAFERHRR